MYICIIIFDTKREKLVLLSSDLPKISFTPGALATFFNQYKISGLA